MANSVHWYEDVNMEDGHVLRMALRCEVEGHW